ncbi:ABC transporter ATP-binding protein/permease [Asticcacaulis sp. DW145]|uniref:ABC transporter ATP-binding protein n=1 Tax=Asticcacaulis sp. DW145 TaxID=3095608 RepID=UPI00308C7354|nr:ABC transporter ATP-binding protein/permease [Asticcacaulis sp. DW145]
MVFSRLKAKGGRFKTGLLRVWNLASYLYSTSRRNFLQICIWLLVGSICEGAALALLYPALAIVTGHPLALPIFDALSLRYGLTDEFRFISLLSAFFALTVFGALAARQRAIAVAFLLSATMKRVRLALFASIAQSSWSFLSTRRSDDIAHLINGEIERLETAVGCIVLSAQNFFFLAIYTLLSLLVSPGITLFSVGVGIGIYLVLSKARRQSGDFGHRLTEFKQLQFRLVGTFLSAVKTIKAYNAEKAYVSSVDKSLTDAYAETNAYVSASTWSGVFFTSLTALALAAFLAVSILVFKASVSEIGTLLIIFSRLGPRFSAVQDQAQALLMNLPAFEALQRLRRDASSHAEPNSGASPLPRLTRDVCLKEVCFSYGDRMVLKDLNLQIRVGMIVAITGPSGGGKSTLADLVLGLQRPQKGALFVDDHRLEDSDCRNWRQQIAYVPQESQIFNGSLRDNLTFGQLNASDEDIKRALVLAHANEFTDLIPGGLDADLSTEYTGLSGGQKQRLSIARAIVRQPRLFVFDEPTSALDAYSAGLILNTLDQLKQTSAVLVISHDPLVIKRADRVLELTGAGHGDVL